VQAGVVEWAAHVESERVAVWLDGEWHRFERVSAVADALAAAADGTVRAPMPGVILAVRIAERERVARGQALVVMEAMKMEHTFERRRRRDRHRAARARRRACARRGGLAQGARRGLSAH
jgi:acetyl/propionyl-CoA carboxylase alpha subunit